ncbi:MAG: rhodanese-like domain-containing protein [Ignavibacteriaceae bacterium]|nr:rhodanese-like domain-containing protein [Ignavibacteriaceae bacterium]
MKKGLVVLIMFSIFNIFSKAQVNPEKELSIDDFIKEMKNNKSLVIVDVRTPEELVGPLGKIDGVINIPVQEITTRFNELSKYKDKEIAVICRTGNRSTFGTDFLISKGYKAKNVLGGMVKYRQKISK